MPGRDQTYFENVRKQYEYLKDTGQHQGLTLYQYEALVDGQENCRRRGRSGRTW